MCRCRVVNEVEQETAQGSAQESSTDSVNINSIHFNKKKHSIITANLRTSTNKNSVTVPYIVDTSSGGNIMTLHIYKKLFPRITNEQLVVTRNGSIQLKTKQQ